MKLPITRHFSSRTCIFKFYRMHDGRCPVDLRSRGMLLLVEYCGILRYIAACLMRRRSALRDTASGVHAALRGVFQGTDLDSQFLPPSESDQGFAGGQYSHGLELQT